MPVEIKGYINPTSISVPTAHLAEIHDGGQEPTDSFTVTKNLTHCAISNEQIGEASYYAEIAPTGGWSDLNVRITVGGVDMSELYSSGVINIPRVTGNIVITAIAASAPLSSITATYTQSGTVYDTDTLDSLKSDLVVTANYEDGTSSAVTDYTLSGTLAEGTSTITVTYGGKTATFSVTVTEWLASISAVYTQSGTVYNTDSLDDLKTDLVVTANYTDGSSAVISDYTLSGTLAVGTSIITVTYGDKTTTFNVTVTKDANGLVDGTYYNGARTSAITVSNNLIKFDQLGGDYHVILIPLRRSLIVESDDVIKYETTMSDTAEVYPSNSTIRLALCTDERGNNVTANKVLGGVCTTATVNETATFTAGNTFTYVRIQLPVASAVGGEFNLTIYINDEEIF